MSSQSRRESEDVGERGRKERKGAMARKRSGGGELLFYRMYSMSHILGWGQESGFIHIYSTCSK